MTRLTIWNEFVHEKEHEEVRKVYPDGIHKAIEKGLAGLNLDIKTATLGEAEHGLTEDVLNNTDVLIWWGHMAHDRVDDLIVERVHQRVMNGMGLIVLHSGHFSKIFKKLMGTGCDLKWREARERERIGSWILPIQSLPVCRSSFCWKKKRCTASISISRRQMSLYSSAGLKAATCSGAAAPSTGGKGKFSISVPVTRLIPPTTMPMCLKSSATP